MRAPGKSDRPSGSAPAVIAMTSPIPVPPVPLRSWTYATPSVPPGIGDAVVIDGGSTTRNGVTFGGPMRKLRPPFAPPVPACELVTVPDMLSVANVVR